MIEYIHTHKYIYIYIYIHIHFISISISICLCIPISIYLYLSIYLHYLCIIIYVYIYTSIYTCLYLSLCLPKSIYRSIHLPTCLYLLINPGICLYQYVYVYLCPSISFSPKYTYWNPTGSVLSRGYCAARWLSVSISVSTSVFKPDRIGPSQGLLSGARCVCIYICVYTFIQTWPNRPFAGVAERRNVCLCLYLRLHIYLNPTESALRRGCWAAPCMSVSISVSKS